MPDYKEETKRGKKIHKMKGKKTKKQKWEAEPDGVQLKKHIHMGMGEGKQINISNKTERKTEEKEAYKSEICL